MRFNWIIFIGINDVNKTSSIFENIRYIVLYQNKDNTYTEPINVSFTEFVYFQNMSIKNINVFHDYNKV